METTKQPSEPRPSKVHNVPSPSHAPSPHHHQQLEEAGHYPPATASTPSSVYMISSLEQQFQEELEHSHHHHHQRRPNPTRDVPGDTFTPPPRQQEEQEVDRNQRRPNPSKNVPSSTFIPPLHQEQQGEDEHQRRSYADKKVPSVLSIPAADCRQSHLRPKSNRTRSATTRHSQREHNVYNYDEGDNYSYSTISTRYTEFQGSRGGYYQPDPPYTYPSTSAYNDASSYHDYVPDGQGGIGVGVGVAAGGTIYEDDRVAAERHGAPGNHHHHHDLRGGNGSYNHHPTRDDGHYSHRGASSSSPHHHHHQHWDSDQDLPQPLSTAAQRQQQQHHHQRGYRQSQRPPHGEEYSVRGTGRSGIDAGTASFNHHRRRQDRHPGESFEGRPQASPMYEHMERHFNGNAHTARVLSAGDDTNSTGHQQRTMRNHPDFSYDNTGYDDTPSVYAPPPAPYDQPPNNRSKKDLLVEISPGCRVPLRGSEETTAAIGRDFFDPMTCFACSKDIFCISDASFVVCPSCRTISPVGGEGGPDSDLFRYGLGLGFTGESLNKIQQEIMLEREKQAYCL